MTGLCLRPATITESLAWCRLVHRRLPRLQGGMWAIAVERDGRMVGIAIVGRPARALKDGHTLTVLRVAALEGDASESGHKGACSMLYAACARAARAMGAENLLTYTHLDEPGVSLRAAGWVEIGLTTGGEHSRPSRPRAPAVDSRPKRRWCAPWSRVAHQEHIAVPS